MLGVYETRVQKKQEDTGGATLRTVRIGKVKVKSQPSSPRSNVMVHVRKASVACALGGLLVACLKLKAC